VNGVINRPEKGESRGYDNTTPTDLFCFAELNSLRDKSGTMFNAPSIIMSDSY
jgi:hypothetical protein